MEESPKLFKLKSYWLLTVILGIASSVISYFVTIKALTKTPLPIPVAYITISILFGLLIIEGLFTTFAARMAKIPNRTYEKAFFTAVGTNFLNSLFSVASLPFVESNKTVAVMMSLISGIFAWFFLKRVYSISHKQVMQMLGWSAVLIGIIGIIAALIGGYFFAAKLKELGI
ncbi:MAG: hypothetical protein RL641_491 [Candidatus Parcubacteria bacterium]|jgi:drug/metabolite transporter (DMT)-like permease